MKAVEQIKRLRSRLFFRMFMIYAVIIVSVISLLVCFILREVTESLLEQAIDDHRQILSILTSYFARQNANFKQIQRGIYLQRWSEDRGLEEMTGEAFANSILRQAMDATREISDFLRDYSLPMDSDIHNLLYADAALEGYVNVSFSGAFDSREIMRQVRLSAQRDGFNINARRTMYLPRLVFSNGVRAYCIHDYLRDPTDAGRVIGHLVAAYSPELIRDAYRSYEGRLMGDLYLLTDALEVIYDSTGKYAAFPYPVEIGNDTSYLELGDKVLIVDRNTTYDFMSVGVIDKAMIRASALPLVRLILLGTFLSVLLILPLCYWNMGSLKRRVLRIRRALNHIQNGDLTVRVEVDPFGDEIDEIAMDVNRMSARLHEMIQKEYALQLNRANAELKQRTAELYALQSQIDPHFLYNTLEAIRMRAVGEGDRATGEMIKLLARIFRRRVSGEIFVTLREEMMNCRDYLELYDMRYEGRLRVEFDVDPELAECGVPHHLLQPIVENAIVHGIDFQREDNEIDISAKAVNGRLVISICDNGQGIRGEKLESIRRSLEQDLEQRGENIGLGNVSSRIRLIYGECGTVKLVSREGRGTHVTLLLPIVSKEALKKRV